MPRAGDCTPGTVAESGTGEVSSLSAVAVLSTLPASRSACTALYVPVQLRLAPGASVAGWLGVHESAPSRGSEMLTWWRVTLPLFVATSV